EDSQNILDTGRERMTGSPSGGSEGPAGGRQPAGSVAGDVSYQLFNIGHNSPVALMDFIGEIEKNLGMEAEKNLMDMQPGDVPSTWADVSDLFDYIRYKPEVGLSEGIGKFMSWYRTYYGMD
ncbi:MAG: hypothetical protein WEC12_05325, partial [Balneolaceae bacterium]